MSGTSPVVYGYTKSIVHYTIPVTGTYTIIADGAQGGGVGSEAGGAGANLGITVTLTAGTVLDILVGGQGSPGDSGFGIGGGGGGGSFVAEEVAGQTDVPLIVAGGGGGAADAAAHLGGSGFAGPGQAASFNRAGGTPPGGALIGATGGTNGDGGMVATIDLAGAGAGGGFFTDGQTNRTSLGAAFTGVGGLSFLDYLSGKTQSFSGGYGGGGQYADLVGGQGGGGGGYSGGGAGTAGAQVPGSIVGGGGGSYFTNAALSVQINASTHTGDGLVEIMPVVACFAAGTRIATPDGEVAVEHLAVGDAVRTHGGGVRPVIWIGRRTIDCARHPRPELVRPVRIAADAFGPGLPARPLFLSPDHALFIDGVLIPVKYLVDGDRVTQVPVGRVTYYHVELSSHDVLLAEGLAAESYLDDGARALFAGAADTISLHPDFPVRAREASGCAPLIVTGPIVAAVRARLAGASRRAA